MQERVDGNQLAGRPAPISSSTRTTPSIGGRGGRAALAEARATGKPILLSVGYAACHWCHVMAHESFEDDETAAVMNDLFVNIKVDREERPDIDAIYMGALHALGEQGGWPLTMFLTSDAEPFWGGTYFPKDARFGRPAFVRVLSEVARDLSRRDRQDPAERRRAEGAARAARRRAGATPRPRRQLADLARRFVARGRSGLWRHQRRAEIPAAAILRIPVACRPSLRSCRIRAKRSISR